MEWKKIFANVATNKVLFSKIYQQNSNLKWFPASEPVQQITLLVTSCGCWMWSMYNWFVSWFMCLCVHKYTHTHTHTHRSKNFTNNTTLALCSDILCDTNSVLAHINIKMMVTRHKVDFMIHWLHLQFDKHRPSVSPCWAGLLVHVSITPGACLLFQILRATLQG